MSTLKVNKLRDTSGSTDAITLDPNGGAVLAGVTTVTSVKVGAAVTISESGIEASGIGITCASINGTQIGGRRNIIINGAMNIAQRGTSSTSSGFYTVDRFQANYYGTNEAPTQAQVALSSSDTPYGSGFRYAYKVTNGNQTGGGGAGKFIRFKTVLEAQDIACSGWNYTSSSNNVTLSFWVKASVAQTYFARLQTYDGTSQNYPVSFALSANTWTKVVKTIPGNSNLQFDNNSAEGLLLEIVPYYGTDYTNGSMSVDAWAAYSDRTPNNTATWYETDDATFEITGVQLEVGSQATSFEHRSFGEELSLCERYCQVLIAGSQYYGTCMLYTGSVHTVASLWKREMRATPTIVANSGTNYYITYRNGGNAQYNSLDGSLSTASKLGGGVFTTGGSGTGGHAGAIAGNNSSTLVYITAEL